MARAHFETYLLDEEGRPIPGATVTVREPDTETTISETVYAEDDSAGDTEAGNPFTADSDGRIEIWLTIPKVVDLYVTKTGYDPRTVRATVHQLTSSTLSVLESGAALEQRSGLDFIASFALTDDSANDNTEIRLDFAGDADIAAQDFDDAGVGGVDDNPARGDHVHPMMANPVTSHESTYTHGDIATNVAGLAAHLADTADAHDASAISILDSAAQYTATDVEAALAEVLDAHQAHLADAADAHDASAISILDSAADFTATDVEGALAELQSDAETHAAAADPHTGYQKESEKDAASGYLGLNASGRPPFPGGARVTFAADRSVAGGGVTVAPLDTATLTEDFDEGGWFTTSDDRFTVPAGYTGYIRATAFVQFAADVDGNRNAWITVAGTTQARDREGAPEAANATNMQCDTGPVAVTAGDDIVLNVSQNSGGALALNSGSWFAIEFLGA